MKRNINKTLKADLCTGCGICEGACPFDAISTVPKKGNFRPSVNADKCTECGRCLKACPGLKVDFNHLAERYLPNPTHYDKMVGNYEKCFVGHSNTPKVRFHSASGGMVTQFLIWLLENKKIDGAIVTKFDKNNPYLVRTIIANTPEDIISGRSSKYSPVSLHDAAQNIKNADGTKYVVVGLPCHIHGMRKLMEIDSKLRNKVVGLFGLYCSCGRSFNMTEFVFKERGININDISYFQYRDEGCLGDMVVKMPGSAANTIRFTNSNSESVLYDNEVIYKEHFQSYYHPLRSFFIPFRCNLCIDHYAELADVSFGDIHIKPYSEDKIGINSIIVKNKNWLPLLKECRDYGAISLDEIPFQTISDSQRMSFKKKGLNGAYINICRKLGRLVPQYDVDYLRQPTMRDWVDFVQTRVQQFLGKHKSLWWLVKILKAKVNIH